MRPSYIMLKNSVSSTSSRLWPSATLLQPRATAAVFNAPRRSLAQSAQGLLSSRYSNTTLPISVYTMEKSMPIREAYASTADVSSFFKPRSSMTAHTSNLV